MGTNGSARSRITLPPGIAVLAWLAGIVAMGAALLLARGLGVRAAVSVAEAFLAVPAVLALVLWRIPVARGLALRSLTPRGWLLSVLAGGVLWVGSVGLLELQYAVWRPPAGYLEAFRSLHDALKPSGPFDALLSIAAIALMPAVCEEILFRGVLLPSFVRALRPWGAILASAALFGIIHLDQTSDGPYTFYRVPFTVAVATGLGFLRVRSGSLLPGLVAHAILNTTTFAAVLLGAPTDAPEQANLLQGASLLLGGLAGSILVLRWFPRGPDAARDPARLDS